MVNAMRRDSDAMAPRPRTRGVLPVALALTTSLALHTAQAQSASRDTMPRVFRFQVRPGDTTTVRLSQMSAARLRQRIDSLRAAFDWLDSDAPEREKVERQLNVLIRTLESNLETVRRATVESEINSRIHEEMARGFARGGGGGAQDVIVRLHAAAQPKGWIGINVEAPQMIHVQGDSAYVRYFTYPRIVSVEPNSPAEEVGIARGDRLVAYNGADVRGEPVNLTRLLRPDSRVVVTVTREGTNRDFTVTVEKAPARYVERRQSNGLGQGRGGRMDVLRGRQGEAAVGTFDVPVIVPPERLTENAPVAGANLTAITSESLGRYFGVSSGVLVTRVFSDPAIGSGLREGDVIVRADGQSVTTVSQLRRLVDARMAERSIELSVIRYREPATVRLRW
jgi:PDZ domain-containing protein